MEGDLPAKQKNLCCVGALVILCPAVLVSPGEKTLQKQQPPAQARCTRPQPPAAASAAAAAAAAAAASLHCLMRSRASEVKA